MPRAGTAVHLQEVFHREQVNGPTAHRMPLCARGLRAVFGSRSGFKEECPRSRECRVQATQTDRQDIFPKKRPNVREKGKFRSVRRAPRAALCSRAQGGIRFISFNGALWAQRRGEDLPGFRRAPPWCRGVISNDHGVQQRRFGAKPGPERTFGGRRMQRHTGARCQGRRT